MLLVLQVALVVVVYLRFYENVHVLLYAQFIFSFVMIIYLFNMKMDSSAKLTWMLIMAVLPFVGAALLLWTKANVGHRMETKVVLKQIENTRGMLE